jgi:hypothetical protein
LALGVPARWANQQLCDDKRRGRTDRWIAGLIVAGTLALYVGSGFALYEIVSTIF